MAVKSTATRSPLQISTSVFEGVPDVGPPAIMVVVPSATVSVGWTARLISAIRSCQSPVQKVTDGRFLG